MLTRIFGAFLLLLVFFAALVTVAVTYGGLWGLAGVLLLFVIGAVVLKMMLGKIVERLFTVPFRMKGAVLKGATLRVHSATPTSAPERRAEDEGLNADDEADGDEEDVRELGEAFSREEEPEEPETLNWYLLDVTIVPQEARGEGFTMWEPGELLLVPPDAKADLAEDSDEAAVESLEIWQEGAWVPDEGCKYGGAQRIRLEIGVPESWRRARFRYYFELFGEVELPDG